MSNREIPKVPIFNGPGWYVMRNRKCVELTKDQLSVRDPFPPDRSGNSRVRQWAASGMLLLDESVAFTTVAWDLAAKVPDPPVIGFHNMAHKSPPEFRSPEPKEWYIGAGGSLCRADLGLPGDVQRYWILDEVKAEKEARLHGDRTIVPPVAKFSGSFSCPNVDKNPVKFDCCLTSRGLLLSIGGYGLQTGDKQCEEPVICISQEGEDVELRVYADKCKTEPTHRISLAAAELAEEEA